MTEGIQVEFMFHQKIQRPHKRRPDLGDAEDISQIKNPMDTFDELANSLQKKKETHLNRKFRVNGHRVDFMYNIQNQVCLF